MTLNDETTKRERSAPGTAAEPRRRPGEAPEYLDVYLPDHPVGMHPSGLGCGQRMVLTLEIGKTRSRVLGTAALTVAWVPTHWLLGGKPTKMAHLPRFIKARRAERHRMGMAVAEEAVRDALELLDGRRVPTRQGSGEEHIAEEADVNEDDKQGAAAGGAAAGQPAGDGAAAAGAAAQPEAGDTTVQTQTDTGNRASRRAAGKKAAGAKPAAKKAAAKPAAKAKAKDDGARVAANEARMAQIIKVKKPDDKGKPSEEGKYRDGPRKVGFDLLKDGETVGAYLKRAEAKGIERDRALRQLAYYEGDGYLTLKKG